MKILVLVCVFLVVYLYSIRKRNNEKFTLHRLVSWVVSEDDHIYRCNLSLLHYIHNTQIALEIPTARRITGDIERNYAKTILSIFSSNLADSFFCDKLECENFEKLCKYSRIDGYEIEIHFFMFQLFKFLRKHECDRFFGNHDMHQRTISYEEKGMWGGPLFDASYELSDFALVYHKMLYISYKFCAMSSIFSEEVFRFVSEESFANVIDTRQINISRI